MKHHGWSFARIFVLLALGGCGDDGPSPRYTVGGTASGIVGSGLTLQLNGANDLELTDNGTFVFDEELVARTTYEVNVAQQPASPAQTCVISNASGLMPKANVVNVQVSCTVNRYTVGGVVTGLQGSGLVLRKSGGENLAIAASGRFTFARPVLAESAYDVDVAVQPTAPSQTCIALNGSGTIEAANVDDVVVQCTTNLFTAGGFVTGLSGTGMVLRFNDNIDVPISANGSFSIPGVYASGSSYSLTVESQPSYPFQTCVPSETSGVVGDGPVAVTVTCTTNTYAIGGTVTGLTGAGLVLRLNNTQELSIANDGTFVFPTPLPSGSTYAVSVKSQTAAYREICAATNATGSVAGADIVSIAVDCAISLSFVYLATGPGNAVIAYGVHPESGALLPLGSTAAMANSPGRLVAAPDGRTLYASNFGGSSISVFSVDSSKGTLAVQGAPIATGVGRTAPLTMAMTPSGKFLYVSNVVANDIVGFSIDPLTGELTSAGVQIATRGLVELSVTPDGKFLYVLDMAGGGGNQVLTVYAIDATTGALTAGPAVLPGDVGRVLAIDPAGRFLYLTRQSFGPGMDDSITTFHQYAIDTTTGALTAVGTGPSVASGAVALVIDPTGRYAYLLGGYNFTAADDHVRAFTIHPTTGVLTATGGSVLLGGSPAGIAVDPSGRFVFAESAGYPAAEVSAVWYDVQSFAVGAAGPTAGQLQLAGRGTAQTGGSSFSAIAVID